MKRLDFASFDALADAVYDVREFGRPWGDGDPDDTEDQLRARNAMHGEKIPISIIPTAELEALLKRTKETP